MTKDDYSSASDEQLVKAAKKGNMAAFEELVARHRDKIFARAFSSAGENEPVSEARPRIAVSGRRQAVVSRSGR